MVRRFLKLGLAAHKQLKPMGILIVFVIGLESSGDPALCYEELVIEDVCKQSRVVELWTPSRPNEILAAKNIDYMSPEAVGAGLTSGADDGSALQLSFKIGKLVLSANTRGRPPSLELILIADGAVRRDMHELVL